MYEYVFLLIMMMVAGGRLVTSLQDHVAVVTDGSKC